MGFSTATREGGVGCLFYQQTAQGWRCVLASPEEWRLLRANGRRPPCVGGGDSCPFRGRAVKRG